MKHALQRVLVSGVDVEGVALLRGAIERSHQDAVVDADVATAPGQRPAPEVVGVGEAGAESTADRCAAHDVQLVHVDVHGCGGVDTEQDPVAAGR